MKGYTKLEWEYLEEKKGDRYYSVIRRAQVPSGWLVESSKYDFTTNFQFMSGHVAGAGYGVGITFVPDQEHKWQGLEKVKNFK
ncbi:MAG: hypothetical protein HZR80_12455 [Candidatus Heimdallarchaeota archaeon]